MSKPREASSPVAREGQRRSLHLWKTLLGPCELDPSGKVVLDLGCAYGALLRFLAEQHEPQRLIGVDDAPLWDTVDHGWDWPALGDLVAFCRFALHDLEGVPSGSVDVVVCIDVLDRLSPEHVAGALAEAFRVLRPGGQLLLRTSCATSASARGLDSVTSLGWAGLLHPEPELRAWIEERGGGIGAGNWLTASTYGLALLRAGFEILRFERRRNDADPFLLERLRDVLPWIDADELDVRSIDVHAVRPVTPADLGLGR